MSVLDTIREKVTLAAVTDAITGIRVTPKGVLKAVAYLIYGMIVFTVVFATKYYVQQADDLARKGVAGLKGITVEFPYLEPRLFPPRVTLDYLRVLDKKTGKTLLVMKDADIKVSPMKLLWGKVAVSFTSRMWGGVVDATISTGSMFNTDWVSLDITTDMVELDKIPQVRDYDETLKGFATLNVSLNGEWKAPLLMEGEVVGTLKQLDMDNRFPVIKGARLKGYDIDIDTFLGDGDLRFERLDVVGENGVAFKASGSIKTDGSNFNKSTLDMKGTFIGPVNLLATSVIDPKAVAMLKKKQALPVVISGNMQSPKITLK